MTNKIWLGGTKWVVTDEQLAEINRREPTVMKEDEAIDFLQQEGVIPEDFQPIMGGQPMVQKLLERIEELEKIAGIELKKKAKKRNS